MRPLLLLLPLVGSGCAEWFWDCRYVPLDGVKQVDVIDIDLHQVFLAQQTALENTPYTCFVADFESAPQIDEQVLTFRPGDVRTSRADGTLKVRGREGDLDLLGDYQGEIVAVWEDWSAINLRDLRIANSYEGNGGSMSATMDGTAVSTATLENGSVWLEPWVRPWTLDTTADPGDENCFDTDSTPSSPNDCYAELIAVNYQSSQLPYYPVTIDTDAQPVLITVGQADSFEIDITTTTGGVRIQHANTECVIPTDCFEPVEIDYDVETGGQYTNPIADVDGASRVIRVRSQSGDVIVERLSLEQR